MVNTRSKIKKTKACFSLASMDHQPSQSADLIGSNDDLLTEILHRLPVTSILRFKSVSKHWRWLLSDRSFTLMHDKLSKSPGIFAHDIYVPFDVQNPSIPPFRSLDFDFERHNLKKFRTLDFYFGRSNVRILQSCNGLLLCTTNRDRNGCEGAFKYYVFNPTTKKRALIPSVPGGLEARISMRFMGLASHQTDCARYKIVCIRSLEPDGELFQIQIYSSDTRKWKISIQSFSASIPFFRPVVYWNGALYWDPSYSNGDCVYFKIDDEQLQTLPISVGLMPPFKEMYFGESRGHLHLIVYNNLQEIRSLKVYEMFSDHSGWFVKYQLQLDALLGAFPKMIAPYGPGFEVIDVLREEDTLMVLKTGKKIITYNVQDKSFKHIFCLPRKGFPTFHRYTATLTSF